MSIGVTKLDGNASRIKVGDHGSVITIELSNIENESVLGLDYVRLVDITNEMKDTYIDVIDYELLDGVLQIQLPMVPKGSYFLEIKDDVGRIYPAEGTLKLDFLGSLEGAKETVFVSYKDEIIGELPTIVSDHMTANADAYKGVQGDPGDTVSNPPKTYTRAEYDALSTYDDNTLYIVKEA